VRGWWVVHNTFFIHHRWRTKQMGMTSATPTEPALDFEPAWRSAFGESPPLGYVLREDQRDHWTRFHALPGSKRYAENAVERATILERANILATECFGMQKEIWISTPHIVRDIVPATDLVKRLSMKEWKIWSDPSENPEDQIEMTFFVARIDWSPGCLDELFWDIAEDRDRALLFSETDGAVLAPYDGGFDIVCLRPRKLAELEKRHRGWMSDRSDKL